MLLENQLIDLAILDPVMHLIDRGSLTLTPEMTIPLSSNASRSLWVHIRFAPDRECDLWHEYYFKCYRMIPKQCRSCWKVCFRVSSVQDALGVLHKLKELDLPSKIGPETRDFTGALGTYGVFFYPKISDGIQGGYDQWRKIRKDFAKYNPILKRGCSEMELAFGDSRYWDELASAKAWNQLQDRLDEIFIPVKKVVTHGQLPLEANAIQRWLDYAAAHGDLSYLNFGHKRTVDYFLYHNSGIKEEDLANFSRHTKLSKRSEVSSGRTGKEATLIQGLPQG